MQLITTHINSDFDGLASMIAAKKLYPDAIMAFPGSQERNVRDFISQHLLYSYEFHRIKDIDFKAVTMLILVDTRSTKRLGKIADCLDNNNLKIHIFDHHLQHENDLTGDYELVKDFGSTTTLLMHHFKSEAIDITPDEATIFALGIYEDTGSLTHLTTTPEDLEAAAWLLQKGAQLDRVAQFITHELTSEQINILHELMKSAKQYTIQDIPIVIISHSFPNYIDEFSLVVKRFMVMENLNVLFAIISMGGRIYLIARSRISDVNVGTIARDLGGGGHATAASATLKDATLIEAQEKLIHTLHRHVHPHPVASEMMSQPAITVTAGATIFETQKILTRYNISAAPVLAESSTTGKSDSSIVGIITRMIVEKATHHNLGKQPVSELMTSEVKTLPIQATFADIQELIIENKQKIIPITHNNNPVGVITRTDLLNRLINDPAYLPKNLYGDLDHPSLKRKRNINSLIVDALDKKMIQLLQAIGMVGDKLNVNSFAVGGFVRDLLLKIPNLDLDIVIEGDGIAFAKVLSKELKGRYRTHERFKTAVVLLPDGFKIDIATARLEYYDYPAALPTVELSSIKLDLYRRDFSINAMAVQLNLEHFGTLVDFFNSQNDLKQHSIKVLHNLSFVEDPSRIFRAVRFEQRMGFEIAPHTKRLIGNAVKMKLFGQKDDPRFLYELKNILAEENPIPAIARLSELHLFQFLWPDLKPNINIDRRFTHILTQAQLAISWFRLLYLSEECENWIVYLLAIMARSGKIELLEFCRRFKESEKTTELLLDQKEQADYAAHTLAREKQNKNSVIVACLEDLKIESLLYIMAIARKNHVKKAISQYVTDLRDEQPLLTGKDLVAMGYKPGPIFKEIITLLKNAKLDGQVKNIDQERKLVESKFPLTKTF